MAETAGHLYVQLWVGRETLVPRGRTVLSGVRRGHASAAVQLQGHIHLYQPHIGLPSQGEQPFVARREGFLHQLPAVSAFHIVVAVRQHQFQLLVNVYRPIHLHGVRERLPFQHADTNLRRVAVVVHHQLVDEIRVVILGIQFQGLFAHGDIEGCGHSAVPGLFHPQVLGHGHIAARSQQVVVLCPGVGRTVALACRQAQGHHVRDHPLGMQSRSDKSAVQAAPVHPQTSHHGQLVRRLIGVFGIGSRHRLGFLVYQQVSTHHAFRHPHRPHPLVFSLCQQAEPCRQLVTRVELMFKHQPCIQVLVLGGVGTPSKLPLQVI